MKKYLGTKLVLATAMTRGEFNEYCGMNMLGNNHPEQPGYLVEYTDGGAGNHTDHKGYISWSPSNAFEGAYQDITEGVSFGHALELMKAGHKVARKGWNGKGMWLILVPGTESVRPVAGTPYSKAGLTEEVNINAHIDMYTAAGDMQPGWQPSQPDMLAEDWVLVED